MAMIPGSFFLLLTGQAASPATPSPGATDPLPTEPTQMVGFVAIALLILSISAVAVVCAYLIVASRRRAYTRDAHARNNRPSPDLPDPWEEASRRVDLEDDDTIPREPGSA